MCPGGPLFVHEPSAPHRGAPSTASRSSPSATIAGVLATGRGDALLSTGHTIRDLQHPLLLVPWEVRHKA